MAGWCLLCSFCGSFVLWLFSSLYWFCSVYFGSQAFLIIMVLFCFSFLFSYIFFQSDCKVLLVAICRSFVFLKFFLWPFRLFIPFFPLISLQLFIWLFPTYMHISLHRFICADFPLLVMLKSVYLCHTYTDILKEH